MLIQPYLNQSLFAEKAFKQEQAPEDTLFSQVWANAHVASPTGPRLAVWDWGFLSMAYTVF